MLLQVQRNLMPLRGLAMFDLPHLLAVLRVTEQLPLQKVLQQVREKLKAFEPEGALALVLIVYQVHQQKLLQKIKALLAMDSVRSQLQAPLPLLLSKHQALASGHST
jgi:hypothetical protein